MTTPSPTAVTNRQPGIRARLWLRGDWIPGCDWGRRDPAVARLWLHLDDGRLLAFRLPAARFEDDRILERLAAAVAEDPRGRLLEVGLEDDSARSMPSPRSSCRRRVGATPPIAPRGTLP